eukprot:scaffold109249_cov66-Attheya_sp.AAC.1
MSGGRSCLEIYWGSILVGSNDNVGLELGPDDGLVSTMGTSLGSDEGIILTDSCQTAGFIDTDGPTLGLIDRNRNMLFDVSILGSEREIEGDVVLGSTLGDFDVKGNIWVLWKDSNSYTWQHTVRVIVGSIDKDGLELGPDYGLVLIEGTLLGSDDGDGTMLILGVTLGEAAGSIDTAGPTTRTDLGCSILGHAVGCIPRVRRWLGLDDGTIPTLSITLGEAAGSLDTDTDGPTLGPINGNMLFGDGGTLGHSFGESEIEGDVVGSTLINISFFSLGWTGARARLASLELGWELGARTDGPIDDDDDGISFVVGGILTLGLILMLGLGLGT